MKLKERKGLHDSARIGSIAVQCLQEEIKFMIYRVCLDITYFAEIEN